MRRRRRTGPRRRCARWRPRPSPGTPPTTRPRMTCSGRGRAGMRGPRTPRGPGAAGSGSQRRWRSWKPSAPPRPPRAPRRRLRASTRRPRARPNPGTRRPRALPAGAACTAARAPPSPRPGAAGWAARPARAGAAARLITAHPPAQDAGPGPQAAAGPAAPGPGPGDSAGPASLITLFLSDAGYLSEHNLTIPGPDRLIATGKTRDLEKAARDGDTSDGIPWASPHIAAMASRLATPEGIAAYRQRGHIAETPHGHIKHYMRFRQLSVRGKPKAATEWTFTCAVHNLFKAITTGRLATAALDRPASQPGHPPAPQAARPARPRAPPPVQQPPVLTRTH